MNFLEDIQNAAIDSSTDLATLLRKCKVFAVRMGLKELEDWVEWESNGYPKGVPIPAYRIWALEVKGTFSGPGGAMIQNAPIPLVNIPERLRESVANYECAQSVASIEATLDGVTDGRLGVNVDYLVHAIGMKFFSGHNCIQAKAQFGTGELVGLLNGVRNRILNFTLAVWKEDPQAGELDRDSEAQISAPRLQQIFNTVVHGGAVNLTGTAIESQISSTVTQGNFASVRSVLTEVGVSSVDIDLLEAAVGEEGKPSGASVGPRVGKWIGKMVQKAAEGVWNVGLEVAGKVLSETISKYYGS